jgi:hypothetical protein
MVRVKKFPFTLSQALFLLRFGQLVVWIDDYLVNAALALEYSKLSFKAFLKYLLRYLHQIRTIRIASIITG